MIGWAAGALFAPVVAARTVSFDKRPGLAVALVSAGMGEVCLRPLPVARLSRKSYRQRPVPMQSRHNSVTECGDSFSEAVFHPLRASRNAGIKGRPNVCWSRYRTGVTDPSRSFRRRWRMTGLQPLRSFSFCQRRRVSEQRDITQKPERSNKQVQWSCGRADVLLLCAGPQQTSPKGSGAPKRSARSPMRRSRQSPTAA